jgi:hypothetical protein
LPRPLPPHPEPALRSNSDEWVKCTLQRREKNSYRCVIDHNGVPYTPDQIDFFAIYVIPANVFYIIPLAATNNQPDILLTPHRQNSKYAKYKEAWHLLMPRF